MVRRLRENEGQRLSEVRLRALADAPTALGEFLKEERSFPEEYWQSLAEDSQEADRRVSLVAEEDGLLVGTVGGLFGPENEVLAFAGLAPYERREQRVFRKRGAMPIAEVIVL